MTHAEYQGSFKGHFFHRSHLWDEKHCECVFQCCYGDSEKLLCIVTDLIAHCHYIEPFSLPSPDCRAWRNMATSAGLTAGMITRGRRGAPNISWRHLCVCVCCCGFPAAATFTPLMSLEEVAQHIPTCLRVSLCAEACLDLNNNGGIDPDRCFTAVTPSHSETPHPPNSIQGPQMLPAGARRANTEALRWTNTHSPCVAKQKYVHEKSFTIRVEYKNKFQPSWMKPAARLFLQITPKNDQWAEKHFKLRDVT